jgi:hypothetical protein
VGTGRHCTHRAPNLQRGDPPLKVLQRTLEPQLQVVEAELQHAVRVATSAAFRIVVVADGVLLLLLALLLPTLPGKATVRVPPQEPQSLHTDSPQGHEHAGRRGGAAGPAGQQA